MIFRILPAIFPIRGAAPQASPAASLQCETAFPASPATLLASGEACPCPPSHFPDTRSDFAEGPSPFADTRNDFAGDPSPFADQRSGWAGEAGGWLQWPEDGALSPNDPRHRASASPQEEHDIHHGKRNGRTLPPAPRRPQGFFPATSARAGGAPALQLPGARGRSALPAWIRRGGGCKGGDWAGPRRGRGQGSSTRAR